MGSDAASSAIQCYLTLFSNELSCDANTMVTVMGEEKKVRERLEGLLGVLEKVSRKEREISPKGKKSIKER